MAQTATGLLKSDGRRLGIIRLGEATGILRVTWRNHTRTATGDDLGWRACYSFAREWHPANHAGELGRRDEVDRGEPRTRTNDHMNIQSVLAACRYEIALLVKSIIRLLWWLIIFALAVSSVYALLHARHVFSVQTSAASTFMFLSLVATFSFAKSQRPDRKTWISVHVCILAAGIAAVLWVPQWSGYIVGTALSLFVFTPNLLLHLALRRASAGYDLAAVFYARLAYFFHPSRQFRFASSLRDIQALGSIDQKVANYRRLALQATPEQFASQRRRRYVCLEMA